MKITIEFDSEMLTAMGLDPKAATPGEIEKKLKALFLKLGAKLAMEHYPGMSFRTGGMPGLSNNSNQNDAALLNEGWDELYKKDKIKDIMENNYPIYRELHKAKYGTYPPEPDAKQTYEGHEVNVYSKDTKVKDVPVNDSYTNGQLAANGNDWDTLFKADKLEYIRVREPERFKALHKAKFGHYPDEPAPPKKGLYLGR